MKNTMKKFVVAALAGLFFTSAFSEVKIASTTSTQNSGLYEYLISLIEKDIGDTIKVIAVGTGQALKLGENGDVDMLIVHAPAKEKAYVKRGFGIDRQEFMYNQFFVVGPKSDPANVKSAKTASEALANIAKAEQKFISRGDSSGTNYKELELWQKASLSPIGDWYLETGSGMGATLNVAASTDGYTLTDSSTWLKFANKQNLEVLFKGDPILFNQYSVILIPTERYPSVNIKKAKEIADWLVSDKGQKLIADYKIQGEPAFVVNAKK